MAAPYGNDQSDNISGILEGTDRWDFFGNHKDFQSGNSSIPYCSGADFSTPSTFGCTLMCSTILALRIPTAHRTALDRLPSPILLQPAISVAVVRHQIRRGATRYLDPAATAQFSWA